MSYSWMDEVRDKQAEARQEYESYLNERAKDCEYYFYDEEDGMGKCTYESDMPECLYEKCPYLKEVVNEEAQYSM